jgi:phenylacetate-CoA ligase
VWRDKRQADIEKAFYAHEWGRLGFSFDKSRYLRIGCDASRPLDQPPAWILGNRLMLSPDHLSTPHKSAIITAINRFKPAYIHAYPSAALALADLLASGDLDFQPHAVLLASEPAAPAQLAVVSRVFRCPVSISYGLTERTNLAFAHHAGGVTSAYQLEPLYGVTETRMTAGQPEIVGTSIWNDVMPLIRYCTGDFGRVDDNGRCDAIEGRLHEFVVDRDGNRIPGVTLALEASSWDFVSTCQIRQCRRGEITLMVVPRQGALTAAQKAALADAPRRYWGSRVDISVEEVSNIAPSPGGKRCFVVSELAARG